MRGKTIVTMVLLAFVAVSVVYLIVTETRKTPATGEQLTNGPCSPSGEGVETIGVADRQGHRLLLPWEQAVQYVPHDRSVHRRSDNTGFPEDLESGRIDMEAVNIDEPGNGHFVDDIK